MGWLLVLVSLTVMQVRLALLVCRWAWLVDVVRCGLLVAVSVAWLILVLLWHVIVISLLGVQAALMMNVWGSWVLLWVWFILALFMNRVILLVLVHILMAMLWFLKLGYA